MSIYLSYRRADAAMWAGRLAAALSRRLGEASIVHDLQFLEAGADFRTQLARALDAADVMLVVIGPLWLGGHGVADRRRMDAPGDRVCHEIANALKAGKRVVPVLVGGASMPVAGQLPADIATLSLLEAVVVGEARWDDDIAHLAAVLQPGLPGAFAPPAPATAAPPRPGPTNPRETQHAPRQSNRLLRVLAAIIGVLVTALLGIGWILHKGGAIHTRPLPVPDRPVPGPLEAPGTVLSWWPLLLTVAAITVAFAAWHFYRRRRSATVKTRSGSAGAVRQVFPDAAPRAAQEIDVFVSHAEEDHELAEAIVTTLERDKLRCWIAPRDIPAGVRSWAGPIVEAIARSRVFVVILSAPSNASIEVLREVTLANEEKVPFMPVRIDDAPLSADFRYFFATAQRTDAIGWPRDRLLSAIHTGVGALVHVHAA